MSTDPTRILPAVSLDGNQCYFVAYDYDNNYIFAEPIPNLKSETIVGALRKTFENLITLGHKLMINITNNQAVRPVKEYLRTQGCTWQFFEPANNRVQAAKRVVQTFKGHMISGFCTTYSNWPIQL